ncbi:MAG: hypothetical protein JRJ12_08665 [Deltaproteobacteria bacterium]|nr:hypothetical protein [Deltaproteobacteria bacterium]MBW2069620.1 hypothetical protein [Deltaproteobacteria bacterium]
MTSKRPFLLIPVENQVRELDAKLLLACIAANRGLSSIIGSKRELEARIATYPKSIYLAKSLLHGHSKFLRIARQLGHEITAWDEDALVHLPAEIYFSRRLSPDSIACVSQLFAWGKDNAELWRQYPAMPAHMPIHVTGNPRNDLLRPEIQPFYDKAVSEIRDQFGDFILINTNFNHVNAFSPIRKLFLPPDKPGEAPRFGRAARGMPREYAEGLQLHKQAVFEQFQKMIPALDRAFPDTTIIVRPHPVESQEIYHRIARECKRVQVTNQGNVVPWLLACRALIHNGCTTSVEAYVIGVPAISYRAVTNEVYDYGFYRLPNTLSHQCFNFDELQQTLQKILAGELGIVEGQEARAMMEHHLAAYHGPLAGERIVDVLEKMVHSLPESPKPPAAARLEGWYRANKRRLRRWTKSVRKDASRSLEHQRKKNPAVPLPELHERIARFQKVLGESRQLQVEQLHPTLFRITP